MDLNTQYKRAVEYIEGISNIATRFDYFTNASQPEVYIARTRSFLKLLGNPHKKLKYIHVTGTSGKGTVSTMIHRGLMSSGKKVGLFTSPYPTTMIELIKVNDKFISAKDFVEILDEMKPKIDEGYEKFPFGGPSYFEINLALALMYFVKSGCEYAVLEVGCGGRYDATNVIEKSEASVITNIDYDHREILGKTLKKIAWQKAGIIKNNGVVFTAEKRKSLLQVFRDECKLKMADLNIIDKSFDHRDDNFNLASSVLRYLKVDERFIQDVKNIAIPCRFEYIQRIPKVILDGAHNRAKIAATISQLKELDYKRLHLVIGLKGNKKPDEILSQIIPFADSVYITRFQTLAFKAMSPKSIDRSVKKYTRKGVKTKLFTDSFMAVEDAIQSASKDDLVLITGSLYMSGELRARWYPEEYILKTRESY